MIKLMINSASLAIWKSSGPTNLNLQIYLNACR